MAALRRALSLVLLGLVPLLPPAHAQQPAPIAPETLSDLPVRSIGPAVTGGRILDVEARPGDPSTIYAATASGGLWKTTNKGTTWQPLFDDHLVSTFGDVALVPSNRQVVWASTSEQNNRQSKGPLRKRAHRRRRPGDAPRRPGRALRCGLSAPAPGPTASGAIHRVQWDLTHPPPPTEDDEPGVVEPDTILPELEYPLEPKGPVVRPGAYTVTFHAAQRADSLHERLQTLAEDRDASDESTALVDTAETRADELGDLRGEIYGLAGVFNWSGVTQPSLRPPTPTHRQRFERLQEGLRVATHDLEALADMRSRSSTNQSHVEIERPFESQQQPEAPNTESCSCPQRLHRFESALTQ